MVRGPFIAEYGYARWPFLRTDRRGRILPDRNIDEDLGQPGYMYGGNQKGRLVAYGGLLWRLMGRRRGEKIVASRTSHRVIRNTEVAGAASKGGIDGCIAISQVMLRLKPGRIEKEGESAGRSNPISERGVRDTGAITVGS